MVHQGEPILSRRFPERRVDDRLEMNDPAHEEEPKHARQDKLDQAHENSTLHELPETGDEEAADGRNNVGG